MPLEMDVLALKQDDTHIWASAIETKNRNEKSLPTMDECKIFMNKLDILKNSMDVKKQIKIYGIYFSANGFSADVEKWLHDQGILTVDWNTWEQV